MDYFTKWLEVFDVINQEISAVAEALTTIFFCRFGVPRELHSKQGRNLESHLMQEASETSNTALLSQSNGMQRR
jgi:hypothetical protein